MSPGASPGAPPLDAIAAEALRLITSRRRRCTPEDLLSRLAARFGTDRHAVRRALRRLVQTGEVQYVYEFGCSFLVPSVSRPVSVSPRVVLTPHAGGAETAGGRVHVQLSHGAAFGTGAHPSTRLAVRAIDHVLSRVAEEGPGGRLRALDVGTGSGVLLLVALKLGVGEGVGIDLDPCALSEARANAALNQLADRTAFADAALSQLAGEFHLVTANLRLPTLMDMAPMLTSLATADARLVVSGIRDEEADALVADYSRAGWERIWQATTGGWTGQAYRRRHK